MKTLAIYQTSLVKTSFGNILTQKIPKEFLQFSIFYFKFVSIDIVISITKIIEQILIVTYMFDPYSNINFQQLLIAFRPQAFTLRVISVHITINYILVHNKDFLIEMTFIFMLAYASCIKCAGNRQRYLMLYDVECFKWIFSHEISN